MLQHSSFLAKAFEVAQRSIDKGNLPFGCILTGPDGNVLLEGENTVVTDEDAIAHCEINLVHKIRGQYPVELLQQCTLYATTEPCPMCTGAIFWSGIGTVVYALSKEAFHAIAGTEDLAHILNMKAAELLDRGGRQVNIIGPVMEEEATVIYKQWLNS
jgi:tRNA(Arg) A34 adenosine deaminase TadA